MHLEIFSQAKLSINDPKICSVADFTGLGFCQYVREVQTELAFGILPGWVCSVCRYLVVNVLF